MSQMRKVYQKFESANIIGVTVEHNGFCGGDAGHGGYVEITIEDLASTNMEICGEECSKMVLTFRGDSERDTLLSALNMICRELEDYKGI